MIDKMSQDKLEMCIEDNEKIAQQISARHSSFESLPRHMTTTQLSTSGTALCTRFLPMNFRWKISQEREIRAQSWRFFGARFTWRQLAFVIFAASIL